MFIDASALVAVLMREEGHREIGRCLGRAKDRMTSGIAIVEATLAFRRIDGGPLADAERIIDAFLATLAVEVVPIGQAETREALAAFARFGKGQGHPARLNLGDCFAYACAKVRGVPLLSVGEDFIHTDIPAAMP